jgi:phospholipase/carboxylesterase
MNVKLTQFGDLNCRLVGAEDQSPQTLVILCHGFGAPGHDLVGLGPAVYQLAPNLVGKVAFAFPEAPLSLDFAGFGQARAWWHLDLEAIERARIIGLERSLAEEEPEGLEPAYNLLKETCMGLLEHLGLGLENLVLGGFSQGAMVTTDLALHLPVAPQELYIFSGNLLHAKRWIPRMAARGKMEVFVSHGQQDPILPYTGAESLAAALQDHQANVEFLPFDGGHTIPHDAIRRLAERLSELCGRGD